MEACMRVRFGDEGLEALEKSTRVDGGHEPGIGKAFRKWMQAIRAAEDERVFYAMKSMRFEKLKGARAHQRSMRLNDQWRLILEFEGEAPGKVAVIVAIEDYHK
jgi:proteic killer suppression protein